MPVAVHKESATCVMATHGPVAIAVWRGIVNVVELDAFIAMTDELRDRSPAGYISLTVATLRVKPPDDAARKRIVALRSAPPAPNFRGSVVVLAGDGFWASVMRSMLAQFNLLGGTPDEQHVRTLEEAVGAVQKRMPDVDGADLLRALQELTAHAGVRV